MNPEDHESEHGHEGKQDLAESTSEEGRPDGGDLEGGGSGGGGKPRRRRNRRRGRRSPDATHGDGQNSQGDRGTERELVAQGPSTPSPDASQLFVAVISGDFDTEDVLAESQPAALNSDQPEGAQLDIPPLEVMATAGDATELNAGDAAGASDDRRVLAPDLDAPKLHKVLAQSGVGSRRDLEQWIVEGRVSVNGEPAHVGQRVSFGDRVAIDGKPVRIRITPPLPRVLAYHKPSGEVVTHEDPQGRPTVFRNLPRLASGKWQSVGRLDINTEGLLLFTNSGDLANRLMHPRFGVEREYAARVLGELSQEERQRLLDGVDVDGYQSCFLSIQDGGGEGANRWYRVVIAEGRYREVRKLFEAVGHVVSRLIRIRYGSVVLPRGLRRGAWVDLASSDVKVLRQMTGAPRQGHGPQGGTGKGKDRRGGRPDPRRREGGRAPRRDGPGGPSSDNFDEDLDHFGPIPNPLQQTYDKRAFQQSRKQRAFSEDGPIPNPLQQTYDKRQLQAERGGDQELDEDGPIPNPLQQTYDKRFASPSKSRNGPKPGPSRQRKKPGGRTGASGDRQPDPLRTSTGFIGADALHPKSRSGGRGGGRRGRR